MKHNNFSNLDSLSHSTKRISGNITRRRHYVRLAHHVTGRGQPQLEQFPRTVFLTSKSPLSRCPATKSAASGLELVISTWVLRRIPGRGNSKRTGISSTYTYAVCILVRKCCRSFTVNHTGFYWDVLLHIFCI
jgi:hypothetical protein